ncbi:hypothetical protein SLS58_001501 [Diplodia intermedia]|uniref:DUF4246 domain-containing protein n=1 Tax=Diplodia intermedia TaxID=856260 RepID=A0ABR3U245_9PEZI
MNLLTDKAEWRLKVFDESVVRHWRNEAVATEGQGFSDEMFNFVTNGNHTQTSSSLPTSKMNSELPSSRSRIIPEGRKNCSLDDCFANETSKIIPVPPADEAAMRAAPLHFGPGDTNGSPPKSVSTYGDTDVRIISYIKGGRSGVGGGEAGEAGFDGGKEGVSGSL